MSGPSSTQQHTIPPSYKEMRAEVWAYITKEFEPLKDTVSTPEGSPAFGLPNGQTIWLTAPYAILKSQGFVEVPGSIHVCDNNNNNNAVPGCPFQSVTRAADIHQYLDDFLHLDLRLMAHHARENRAWLSDPLQQDAMMRRVATSHGQSLQYVQAVYDSNVPYCVWHKHHDWLLNSTFRLDLEDYLFKKAQRYPLPREYR